jgi:hypothetical protein
MRNVRCHIAKFEQVFQQTFIQNFSQQYSFNARHFPTDVFNVQRNGKYTVNIRDTA